MNKFPAIHVLILMMLPLTSYGDRVTININASVVERSCTISDGSLNATVSLQTGDLRNSYVGVPFSGSKFSISLEDCPENISTAKIKFSGESDPIMSTLLKNTGDGESAAKGVALGLYDNDNKAININGDYKTLTIDATSSVNTFNFFARYVRVSDTYSAGNVLSVANFELSYD